MIPETSKKIGGKDFSASTPQKENINLSRSASPTKEKGEIVAVDEIHDGLRNESNNIIKKNI